MKEAFEEEVMLGKEFLITRCRWIAVQWPGNR